MAGNRGRRAWGGGWDNSFGGPHSPSMGAQLAFTPQSTASRLPHAPPANRKPEQDEEPVSPFQSADKLTQNRSCLEF